MRPRVPRDERLERRRFGLGERRGDADWERRPECVPVPRRVLDRDEPFLAGDVEADRAGAALELGEPTRRVADRASSGLLDGEIAEPAEEVVRVVGVPRSARRREVLQLQLERVEGRGSISSRRSSAPRSSRSRSRSSASAAARRSASGASYSYM